MNMKALLQPATKKARPLCSQRGGVRQHPDSSAGTTLHFAPASGKSKMRVFKIAVNRNLDCGCTWAGGKGQQQPNKCFLVNGWHDILCESHCYRCNIN
jgi:hypothetical protein